MRSLGEQLRSNAVAIISLIVAVSSLGYNTWRNERTEHNRNVRTAAFEVLMRAADLERVAFLAQYDRDARGGSPRNGWTDVLEIRDLAALVPPPVPERARELEKIWGENWEGLGKQDEIPVNRIDDAIGKLRETTLAMLKSLR